MTDLHEAIGRALALGATQLGEITVFPERPCVYLRDPSGTFIEFEEFDE